MRLLGCSMLHNYCIYWFDTIYLSTVPFDFWHLRVLQETPHTLTDLNMVVLRENPLEQQLSNCGASYHFKQRGMHIRARGRSILHSYRRNDKHLLLPLYICFCTSISITRKPASVPPIMQAWNPRCKVVSWRESVHDIPTFDQINKLQIQAYKYNGTYASCNELPFRLVNAGVLSRHGTVYHDVHRSNYAGYY